MTDRERSSKEAMDSVAESTGGWVPRLTLALFLALAWLLWSGIYKPLLLALGGLSCVLVVIAAKRLHLFDHRVYALSLSLRLFRYWAWLGGEVVRSSIDVTRRVLSPRMPISPTLVEFESLNEHPVDQAILGNSITLTPGTLTLKIDGNKFLVHALSAEGAAGVETGEMDRRVSQLRAR